MLALPFALAGGTSGAYYLRLHRVSRELSLAGLPQAPRPAAARRVLVLAPHCDDETLGVGGMIADARRAGAQVTVAFLTNGDGFPLAAGRSLKEVHLSPGDYIRFAERRQQESVAALNELGVPDASVVFLGYPDRGLASLWEENWDPSAPFRSRYTGHTGSPYRRNYTPNAPYCGASLLADLSRLMETTRPTDIYVTHPADDHPDHAIAAAFAQAAVLSARDRDREWARAARLRHYLVHRGDWPLPQGLHADKPLLPPAALAALDTKWEVYPLSPEARAAKARALTRYVSQMAVMRRFLTSFVRENELFGALPEERVIADATWKTAPTVRDAVRDDVVRLAGPSADVRRVAVRRGRNRLHVRLTTCGPISPRVRYSLQLRAEGDGPTRFMALNLPVRRDTPRSSGDPATVTVRGDTIEASVPLEALDLADAAGGDGPRRVWVAAETRWARMPVDRTGFQPFLVDRPAPKP